MKTPHPNISAAIILGLALFVSTVIYVIGTRYQHQGSGYGAIDRWTGHFVYEHAH